MGVTNQAVSPISNIAKATTVMTQVCDNLRQNLAQLSADLDMNSWLPIPLLREAFRGADLDRKQAWVLQLRTQVDNLRPEGGIGARVLAGAYAWAKWDKDVTDINNQIAHEYGDVKTWGMRGLIDGVVIKTAVDSKNLVVDTGNKVSDTLNTNFYPVLILVVVGLIAFAVVKVA